MRFRLPLCFALIVATVAVASPIPPAVVADPAPDKASPPLMLAVTIPSHGAEMNGVIYVPAGAGPHPALVLLHGFPGNEQNLDLAQAARRAGWSVLTLHYRGSWGSPGAFSFSNAIEDSAAAVAFLRLPDTVKRARLATGRIAVAGHSMGGFMAAITVARDPAIIGLGLISAWNIGYTVNPGQQGRADRAAGLKFMAGSLRPLVGCTAESLVDDALSHAREWDFVEFAPKLASRPLLLISASGDNNGPQSDALAERVRTLGGTALTEIHLDTDHSYSGQRIALQAAFVSWLDTLARVSREAR
jgi:uncharacterized protein